MLMLPWSVHAWSAIHTKWYESAELSECYHMQNLTFIASVLQNNNIVKIFWLLIFLIYFLIARCGLFIC